MTANPFARERLRLNGSAVPTPAKAPPEPKKPPRRRPKTLFLKGPVPWPWLERAAALPGKALAVGLCLWQMAGRRPGPPGGTVKLCLSHAGLGVNKQAARRALRELERAGLVSVVQRPGRGLDVTLLDAPATN
jgi:hypothetical protein